MIHSKFNGVLADNSLPRIGEKFFDVTSGDSLFSFRVASGKRVIVTPKAGTVYSVNASGQNPVEITEPTEYGVDSGAASFFINGTSGGATTRNPL